MADWKYYIVEYRDLDSYWLSNEKQYSRKEDAENYAQRLVVTDYEVRIVKVTMETVWHRALKL